MNWETTVKKIMRQENINAAQMGHRLTVDESQMCREYNVIRWMRGITTPSPLWQARIKKVFPSLGTKKERE